MKSLALVCGLFGAAACQSLCAQNLAASAVPPSVDTLALTPAPITASAPYNSLILEEIRTMPQGGGYSAGHDATQRLGSAVQLGPDAISIEAARAQPSYCSGATYLVFLKAIDALARRDVLPGDARTLSSPADRWPTRRSRRLGALER